MPVESVDPFLFLLATTDVAAWRSSEALSPLGMTTEGLIQGLH